LLDEKKEEKRGRERRERERERKREKERKKEGIIYIKNKYNNLIRIKKNIQWKKSNIIMY